MKKRPGLANFKKQRKPDILLLYKISFSKLFGKLKVKN